MCYGWVDISTTQQFKRKSFTTLPVHENSKGLQNTFGSRTYLSRVEQNVNKEHTIHCTAAMEDENSKLHKGPHFQEVVRSIMALRIDFTEMLYY